MAKGGNNSEAIKLQNASLKESRLQAARMEAMMKASTKAAERQVMPAFEGAAPAPTVSSADIEAAGNEMRTRLMRRQGYNSTVYAGAK